MTSNAKTAPACFHLAASTAERSIPTAQMKLKRARLADDLNEKIALRPGPLELVEKNILPMDSSVKEAIKGSWGWGRHACLSHTCETQGGHSSQLWQGRKPVLSGSVDEPCHGLLPMPRGPLTLAFYVKEAEMRKVRWEQSVRKSGSCDPSTWEAEMGESPRLQGQPGLHRQFWTNLSFQWDLKN